MRRNYFHYFIVIIFFALATQAQGTISHKTTKKRKPAAATAPFESKEGIKFTPNSEIISLVPDHKSFMGVLQRLDSRHPTTEYLQLFIISKNRPKLTDTYCGFMTKFVLGIGPQTPESITKISPVTTPFGSACHVSVKNEDPYEREKHVVIFTVKSGTYALEMKNGIPASEDEIYEFESFVKGLQ